MAKVLDNFEKMASEETEKRSASADLGPKSEDNDITEKSRKEKI